MLCDHWLGLGLNSFDNNSNDDDDDDDDNFSSYCFF